MLGKFLCKVKEIGISKDTKGNTQVVANIEYYPEAGGKLEKTWFGSMTAGAAAVTLQTLSIMGYKFGYMNLEDIAEGRGIDFTKELEVVINENDWQGKKSERITGVFEVGSAGYSKMNPAEAVQMMKGQNINSAVMAFMQEKGIKAPVNTGAANDNSAANNGTVDPGVANGSLGKETPF